MSLVWVSLFVGASVLCAQRGAAADHRVSALLAATLLFSLIPQPLTLGLVYLDGETRAQQRRVAGVAPIVALAVVGAAVYAGWWWAVVPVAAGWNLVHTVHQRYGILRVYGRKGGYGVA